MDNVSLNGGHAGLFGVEILFEVTLSTNYSKSLKFIY